MKKTTKLSLLALSLALPLTLAGCSDDASDTDGMGGDSAGTGGGSNGTGGSSNGTGGSSNGTGGDGTGGGSSEGLFSAADCKDAAGPKASVTGFDKAGAFVDGNWLEGWTNFSIDSTPEDDGSAADGALADVTTDTTLAEGIYTLDSVVYVEDGATLTIEAGTIIRGSTTGSLIVSRGGKLIAKGTKDKPIIFTSAAANGSKAAADWGGVILLGKAKNWNDEELIEGMTDAPANYYGGSDDTDSSGELAYVRIEFGGTEIAAGNEINGLTLGSVGSGTKLSYIQVNTTLDDGIEWFGGTHNADHLVSNNAGDDMFDADQGFRGELSYLFGRQISPLSGDPNGFEMDGDNGDAKTSDVDTKVDASFATLCGTGSIGLNVAYGAVLREELLGSMKSLVVVGFDAGFDTRNNFGSQGTPNVTIADSYSGGHFDGVGYDETDTADDCSGVLCDDDSAFSEIDWFQSVDTNVDEDK